MFSALDAYIYGFALTESTLPFAPAEGAENSFAEDVAPSPDEYPHLARALEGLMSGGTYSFADEFDVGLDLLLEGFERRLAQAS